MAGQHGDETRGRHAARRLISRAPLHAEAWGIDLGVIVSANPDGAATRTRVNARGVDLNRDHAAATSAEIRALHALVREWRPHAIVDLHTYPSRRTHLLARRLVLPWDVCVDVATHPAARAAAAGADDALVSDVVRDVEEGGCSASRYLRFTRGGIVRHSTPRLADARNVLALRYDATTILVEGRTPTRLDGRDDRARLRLALDATLDAILERAADVAARAAAIGAIGYGPGARLPVGWRWRGTERPLTLLMRHRDSGAPVAATFERYRSDPRPARRAIMPEAYAVPITTATVLAVLRRHRFESRPGRRDGEPCDVFPLAQRGGRLLALLLDPRSRTRLADAGTVSRVASISEVAATPLSR